MPGTKKFPVQLDGLASRCGNATQLGHARTRFLTPAERRQRGTRQATAIYSLGEGCLPWFYACEDRWTSRAFSRASNMDNMGTKACNPRPAMTYRQAQAVRAPQIDSLLYGIISPSHAAPTKPGARQGHYRIIFTHHGD